MVITKVEWEALPSMISQSFVVTSVLQPRVLICGDLKYINNDWLWKFSMFWQLEKMIAKNGSFLSNISTNLIFRLQSDNFTDKR